MSLEVGGRFQTREWLEKLGLDSKVYPYTWAENINSVTFIHRNITKWDIRGLNLAKEVSTWSKDPSTKVGVAIFSGKNEIVSTGYNGFPSRIIDTQKRYADRAFKYPHVIHAEINAILRADRDKLKGSRMYLHPLVPCSHCAPIIIESGITEVICPADLNERWIDDYKLTVSMFNEAGIKLLVI